MLNRTDGERESNALMMIMMMVTCEYLYEEGLLEYISP